MNNYRIDLIKACSDLGVNIQGAELAPDLIVEKIDLEKINKIYKVEKKECVKENNVENKKKNIKYINYFNEELYGVVQDSLVDGSIPITIGGDHSISIATALASQKYNKNIGVIWFDAHADFNTFETTITGNIHGLPFATITGFENAELAKFHKYSFINPKNCVLIGARSIDYPGEYNNLNDAGVKIFTVEDIRKNGIEDIVRQSIEIVTKDTEGFHFSIDIDVMDPKEAPGVSVPEIDGITKIEFLKIIKKFLEYREKIKSIDIVEYNPKFDVDGKTLKIIVDLCESIKKSFLGKI